MTELPVLNADELMARLGGSRSALAGLLPALAESASLWEAEMNAALAAADAERLRRAAHRGRSRRGAAA